MKSGILTVSQEGHSKRPEGSPAGSHLKPKYVPSCIKTVRHPVAPRKNRHVEADKLHRGTNELHIPWEGDLLEASHGGMKVGSRIPYTRTLIWGLHHLLGGSLVVISGVISPVIWNITIVSLLITPLITTQEASSRP